MAHLLLLISNKYIGFISHNKKMPSKNEDINLFPNKGN